jgi:AAA domain
MTNAILDPRHAAKVLGGEVSGNQVRCPGPGHSAEDRSLSVKLDSAAPNGFIVHSFTSDDPLECRDYVCAKFGLEPFKPNGGNGKAETSGAIFDRMAERAVNNGPRVAEAIYDYTDRDGNLIYQVLRYRLKKFLQRRPDPNGEWIWSSGDRKVLYRWPDLVKYPDASVFVCEGEKDADRVASLGLCATTVSGSTKWEDVDVSDLAGRDILVLEDNDKTGREKALAAATALQPKAATLRIVRLPRLAEAGDVSDWLDALGCTGEEAARRLTEASFEAPLWPITATIITLQDWLARALPEPDFVMGRWLTTTTRAMLWAPTGIGKTLWALALAMHMSGRADFLGWGGQREVRCLYIDGEMSQRLLKKRLIDEYRRSGLFPPGLFILSHADIPDFASLNTPEGQAQIERVIARIGGIDFLFADNIMSLVAGDMKDEEGWRQTLPWAHSLTRRNIGQLWVHHTGHDETRGYGTKTREWQMDTVISLETVKRDDTDVSFRMAFRKARERTPETREEFADKIVALVNDQWEYRPADGRAGKIAPLTAKFLQALVNATVGNEANKMHGCPAASVERWRHECVQLGILERAKDGKGDAGRALFSKQKRALIAVNRIACNDTMAWILP